MSLPDLWEWQRAELSSYGLVPKRALFASPRLGKTRVAVEGVATVASAFERNGRSSEFRGLWTGPRVTIDQSADVLAAAGVPVLKTWKTTRKSNVAPLTVAQIDEMLREMPSGVLCINDDKLPFLVERLKKWAPQVVIGDESHRWRGVSTKRARAARRLCWQAKYVRLLTGTPAPSHYGNLWGQMVALDKREVDAGGWGSSYEDFARHFLVRDSMFPSRVLAHVTTEQLQRLVLRDAGIYRREDIWGVDRYQIIERAVDMPAESWAIYDKLAKDWIIDSPAAISADNVLARMMRLRQIASGHLPNEQGDPIELHTAKIDAALADLYEPLNGGEHVAIFHRFRYEGEQMEAAVRAEFPNVPVFTINGSNSARGKVTAEEFNAREGAAVIIVQTQSGGVGISLRTAAHSMFLSEDFNFDEEKQALDRVFEQVHGIVIPRTVTYIRVAGSVDDYIATCKEQKRTIHDAVTNADRAAMVYGYIRRGRSKAA